MMERIWAYFIQLGFNMWRDKWSWVEHRGPIQCQATGRYQETMLTDRTVWRNVIDQLPSFGINTVIIDIGEGLLYDSHPELSIPGAWTREELREELKKMRALGLEPVPKLNFSSCHDTWLGEYAWMKGTQKYYQVVKDLIDEVCEVFDNPCYFHVGMDEEDMPNHKKGITIIRCRELWYRDLYYYIDCVEKHGARPWVWGDYIRENGDDFGQRMPKDCIVSTCWYARFQPKVNGVLPQKGYRNYMELSHMGYDQIPCTSDWSCNQNTAQTVWFFMEEGLVDEHLLGFLAVPWQHTIDVNYYNLLNNAQRMKYARKMFEERYPAKNI